MSADVGSVSINTTTGAATKTGLAGLMYDVILARQAASLPDPAVVDPTYTGNPATWFSYMTATLIRYKQQWARDAVQAAELAVSVGAGEVSTTDATPTFAVSYELPENSQVIFDVAVTGRCTATYPTDVYEMMGGASSCRLGSGAPTTPVLNITFLNSVGGASASLTVAANTVRLNVIGVIAQAWTWRVRLVPRTIYIP
jgi:hypothetical protein